MLKATREPTESTNNTTLSEEERPRRLTWFHLLKQLIGSTAPDQHLRGHVAVEENCRQKHLDHLSYRLKVFLLFCPSQRGMTEC